MQNSQSTTATVEQDGVVPAPDLTCLPPVFVLAAHLSINEQQEIEESLSRRGASLTYDIKEANVVLGNTSTARRAKFELQWKGVCTKDIEDGEVAVDSEIAPSFWVSAPAKKRRRLGGIGRDFRGNSVDVVLDGSRIASETADDTGSSTELESQLEAHQVPIASISSQATGKNEASAPPFIPGSLDGKVIVVKLEWLNNTLLGDRILPFEPYTVYKAQLLTPDKVGKTLKSVPKTVPAQTKAMEKIAQLSKDGGFDGTLERAKHDPKPSISRCGKRDRVKEAANQGILGRSISSPTHPAHLPFSPSITRPTHLLHQTTSEHEESISNVLPPMPDWVLQNKIYSCERATPLNPPNKDFICKLKKIKLARALTFDEIGVRAYSTIIASLAAYPHNIQTRGEILALPGCDQRVAHLFHEYKTNGGHIQAVADLEADPTLKVLREFYEIWGVGAVTAREFYYDKKWRDLDDILEHGWKSLSRVQQIGLKYLDEFKLKISRTEVEAIAAVITKHAKIVTDNGIETIIVGGYRRGKAESGDVDVILSHRDPKMTLNLADEVVKSLEKEGWITHTLTLNLTNTKREQESFPIYNATVGGHGFDTLDKALVVWQDPNWPTAMADLAANPKSKNPNPHRRVDIIISPWRTVGCAIAGWTSGTTFQRDLRRYAKKVKGWKFDSSGVRERGTGRWVDLERWSDEKTRCRDWREAEKRVFEGFGLVWREPWERCTG